ncbi:unnamed protein product, partial [marine sediment metagenome]
FERFYTALLRKVFGEGGMGEAVVDFLGDEAAIFVDSYDNFDRVLLSPASAWFSGMSREEVFRQVARESLSVPVRAWGSTRKLVLSHILFGGKLPRFLGFDRGPITLIGGRATIHQGQIYRNAGRLTSFAPSQRLVTDMAEERMHTNLAGGPSDRRFSRWYCSDLKNWRAGRYKALEPRIAPGDRIKL